MTTHKQWLDNEYQQWIKALQESTVHNFKEHPGVKRMLGEPENNLWYFVLNDKSLPLDLLHKIDIIGRTFRALPDIYLSSVAVRMIYYAQQILKLNPSSICEIGGGVGQFYAILRALGYDGNYMIKDLLEVELVQIKYLEEVARQTGLELNQFEGARVDLLVSFYALGEFDNETKQKYEELINNTPRGYIAWNAHSGASDDLSIFESHDIKVTPGIEEGIKIITW